MLLSFLLMAGCRVESRYNLLVEPIVPPNLELGRNDPDVTLLHRDDSQTTLLPLGALDETTFGDLPPLGDGTLGLLLTDPDTASEDYTPSTLRAYGEAALDGSLGTDGEDRTVAILMAEFAGTGELGELLPRAAPVFGAAVLLPDGVAVTFGGQRAGEPHAAISMLQGLPRDFDADEVDPLPAPRVLHTATVLDDGTVLIAGGRAEYLTVADNLASALIWDPSSQEVVWTSDTAMQTGRSRHAAVKMRDGRVLVVGGWQGAGVDAEESTYQFYDPEAGRFRDPGRVAAGPLGLMATSLGGDGALVCGGFRFDLDAEQMTPSAVCERVTVTGDPIPFDPLPIPLGLAAIAALPDGRVLVAGGVAGPIEVPLEDGFLTGANTGSATDQAWLFTPGSGWEEVGPMVEPRAAAVAVPSGDGRIVLIGGSGHAGLIISDDADPVFCPEVFDPDTLTFEAGGSCSTPGSGAFPSVSVQPGIGAFVVEGHEAADGVEAGGRAYGIIGLAPPL